MSVLVSLTVPLVLALTALCALTKKVDVFSAAADGAKDGLKTVLRIFPTLVVLFPAIYMLRASGFLDAVTVMLTPLLSWLKIPAETVPLLLIRPFSGSAALAVGAEIIARYGANSLVGRTAAVMLGSTETTFYVISVYFGSLNIKKTRWAVPAALCADAAGFITAAAAVRML